MHMEAVTLMLALLCVSSLVSQSAILPWRRFQMHKLELALNIDAAMGAARDYFERVMREVHGNAPGSAPLASRGNQSSCRYTFNVCIVLADPPGQGCCCAVRQGRW